MNILIADDDKDAAAILVDLLQLKGHTADYVHNGCLAYERLLTGQRYDLLIIDLSMPLMNGLELLVKARKENLIHCPVVMSTAYDPSWVAGVAGVDYFLPKPVDELQLDATLAAVELVRKLQGDPHVAHHDE